MAGKEIYLHLNQRQFYCPECDPHLNERFNFVAPQRKMTRHYERYVYECCKASMIQKVSTRENLVWQTVNEIYQQNVRQELDQCPSFLFLPE